MKTVTIYQPRIPGYRTSFFDALMGLGNVAGINYRIIAPAEILDIRNDEDSGNQSIERIKTLKFKFLNSEIHFFNPKEIIYKSDLVISEHALHDFFAILRLLHIRRFPLALWGHGRTYTAQTSKIKEFLKKLMITRAVWYFAYTSGVRDYVAKNTDSPERITVLNNSIDASEIEDYMIELADTGVDILRSELSLFSQSTAIFIGALDDSKRIDFILEAVKKVRQIIPDFELAVCGDGPDRNRILEKKTDGIHYLGFADAKLKAKLAQIGLFILNPGRVGLLAVDSFCLGMPIITTDWEFHAPEFEYLQDNKTAVITKDDVDEYVLGVVNYLKDEKKIYAMKSNCLNERQFYSIEKMALRFHDGVLKFLKDTKHG
jgi:glycosyltransferase involved in cell wall biosynthesis